MKLIDMTCLRCGAKPGEPCTGRPVWSGFHFERIMSKVRLDSVGPVGVKKK